MMKKIITILFVLISFSAYSQTKGWTIEAFKEFILTGDSLRATTQIDVNDTTLATKQYVLNTTGAGNGWDSLTWNNTTGQIVWWYAGSRIDSMNIDNRYVLLSDSTSQYLTADSINNLVNQSGMQAVYSITLPSSTTIAGRIAGAIDVPSGWTLSEGANSANLDIQHNLGRRVANVSVTYLLSGTEYKALVPFNNAYSTWSTQDTNNLRIEGLTTIQKTIQIFITFE